MEMVAEVVVEMDLLDNSGSETAPEAVEDWRLACWVMDH